LYITTVQNRTIMPSRSEIYQAVNIILNDVIEQSFSHLVRNPQGTDELNQIIREASEDLNYYLLKIDAHNHRPNSKRLEEHYLSVTKEAEKKSLYLLARLQRLQRKGLSSTSSS